MRTRGERRESTREYLHRAKLRAGFNNRTRLKENNPSRKVISGDIVNNVNNRCKEPAILRSHNPDKRASRDKDTHESETQSQPMHSNTRRQDIWKKLEIHSRADTESRKRWYHSTKDVGGRGIGGLGGRDSSPRREH